MEFSYRDVAGLPYVDSAFVVPVKPDFKRKCKNLARRKHTRAYFIGFSRCGMFSIWQGMLHGNLWAKTESEIDSRLRL